MSMKFVIAAVAAGFLVASCGDDSGSGGGGSVSGSAEMVAFVKNCQAQMDKRMAGQVKKLDALGSELKNKFVNAARGMCTCIGKEVDAAKGISADDKKKIFAVKDFSPRSKPEVSADSKKALDAVGKKCVGQMMTVVQEVMKAAAEKMKK